MNRTEQPTDKKIAQLRSEGIVPMSLFCVRCVLVSTILALSLFFLDDISQKLQIFFRDILLRKQEGSWAALSFGMEIVSHVCVVFALFLLGVGFLSGLLQTKFFISLGQLSFRAGRLNPFRMPSFQSFLARLSSPLVLLVVSLCFGGLVCWILFGSLLTVFNRDMNFLFELFDKGSRWAVALLSFLFLVLGTVSWYLQRLFFYHSHRMTKQEVEAER